MARYERSYTGEHRTVKRTLQLTPSEAAELDAGAEHRGLNWSDFARELLLQRLPRRPARRSRLFPEDAAIIRDREQVQHELNAVGNLLNQIARHANMTGQLTRDDLDDLKDALHRTKQATELYTSILHREFST